MKEIRESLPKSSHLWIKYYDTSRLYIDLRDVNSYTLYDLGAKKTRLYDSLPVPNDFYYARIQAFNQNIWGTLSTNTSCSSKVCRYAASSNLTQSKNTYSCISIATCWPHTIYLWRWMICMNWRCENRLDLENDTDGDGDIKNDIDTQGIEIYKNPATIKIRFGPYDHLFEKRTIVEDDNGNIGTKEVWFEVYSPNPRG